MKVYIENCSAMAMDAIINLAAYYKIMGKGQCSSLNGAKITPS
jgi:hypothetical protein